MNTLKRFLSGMIHEILENSKLNFTAEPPMSVVLSDLLMELCEPYQLIAAARQIAFSLDLPEQFYAILPISQFSKAVSNVLTNAVAYTILIIFAYFMIIGRSK